MAIGETTVTLVGNVVSELGDLLAQARRVGGRPARQGYPVIVAGRTFSSDYEVDGQPRSVPELEAWAVGPQPEPVHGDGPADQAAGSGGAAGSPGVAADARFEVG